MTEKHAIANGIVFDGTALHHDVTALFEDGVFVGCIQDQVASSDTQILDFAGDIVSPGFVDLQVNGGGGVMLGDDPCIDTLSEIAEAHRTLGTTHMLPTLITDTPEKAQATISAVRDAIGAGIQGIAGLHLEGPHISHAKKGAHESHLIRSMTAIDLAVLTAAKADIPCLMVTVAPEAVSLDQVATLAEAGILVSLGHTNADFETCLDYIGAGVSCVTHLFNAMSQVESREPGLAGATLHSGQVSAGLIADGIHVHPATLRVALDSKAGPGKLYLVSDAMAVAGTSQNSFQLYGRNINRQHGRLTLEDGTLAGADLDLAQAVCTMVKDVGIPLKDALSAATTTPAKIISVESGLVLGQTKIANLIRLSSDLSRATPIALDFTD